MRPHPLTVFGVTGRMGQSLIRALREDSEFHLRGAVASAGSARLGSDAAADGPPTGVVALSAWAALSAQNPVAIAINAARKIDFI